jgi:LL-diaminopimelate aminotransferase
MSAASRLLGRLPPYPFLALEQQARSIGRGAPLLRFGIGDPDLPPPAALADAARAAMRAPDGNRYSSSRGEGALRTAFARYFERRFGVRVDPESEVCVLVGSKEGLAALPRALLDPGDSVLVPDPGYPAYENAVRLGRLRPRALPLEPGRGWLPEWERAPAGAGLVYLNYPNNPTGAVATLDDLRPSVDHARDHDLWIAYDNAYSELTFSGAPAPSLLEIPAARERTVEFHSLSKTLGIPGWRLGFAVGPAAAIRALVELKSHSDSGAPTPLQRAAASYLDRFHGGHWPAQVRRSIAEYGRRLDRLARGLTLAGFPARRPSGTLYLWQSAPEGDGARFAEELLARHRVLVTPGAAFGHAGRPYVRWAVTSPRSAIDAAIGRLGTRRRGTSRT